MALYRLTSTSSKTSELVKKEKYPSQLARQRLRTQCERKHFHFKEMPKASCFLKGVSRIRRCTINDPLLREDQLISLPGVSNICKMN